MVSGHFQPFFHHPTSARIEAGTFARGDEFIKANLVSRAGVRAGADVFPFIVILVTNSPHDTTFTKSAQPSQSEFPVLPQEHHSRSY
jgi:hypothetical protein